MAQRIRLVALPDTVSAVPGGRLDLVLTLGNDGGVVDRYLISVGGVPADWYDLATPAVALFPGDSTQVALTLHPPAGTDAGSYRIVVVAVAEDDPTVRVSVPIALVVNQVGAVSMEILPPAAQGRAGAFRVTFGNGANAAVTMLLAVRDDQKGLRFYRDPPGPVVAPAGGAVSVMVRVVPRARKLIGAAHPYQIEFRGLPADDEADIDPFLRRDGVLVRHARYTYLPRFNALLLPRWMRKLPALVPLALLLLLLLATAAVANRPPVHIPKPHPFLTYTPIPTPTTRPTYTPFPTPTLRPTYTPMPSATARPTYTNVPTITPLPTARPTITAVPLAAIRIDDFGVRLGAHSSVQLVWSVSRAPTVRLNGQPVRAVGSRPLRLGSTATFILSATRGRETVVRIIRVTPRRAALVVPSIVASLPVIQQFATQADAASGASSLVWAVHGADEVTLNGVRVAASATLPITPTAGVTYRLRAANALGTVTASVVIVVSPPSAPGEQMVLHLPAIRQFAVIHTERDHTFALVWRTQWASTLTLDGQPRALSGRIALPAPLHSHTYQLIARNAYGSARAAVRIVASGSAGGTQLVVVSAPRITRFDVRLVQGRLLAAWQVLNATHVWLDGQPAPSAGERHVPRNATVVRLAASNDAGSVRRVVRIERVQPPAPSATATSTPTATATRAPAPTRTPSPTGTTRPAATGTPTPSPTSTAPPLIIPSLPTLTLPSTATPTPAPTATSAPPPSPTPASVPTATATPSPTATPTSTPTTAPPPLSISPAALAWGRTLSTTPLTVTVSNVGAVVRTITAVTIGGANPTGFAIAANNCSGVRLTPGGSCAVVVDPVGDAPLTPSCALTASLAFADDAGDTLPSASLTYYQPLDACYVPPAVSSTLTFGVQGVGTSGTQPLTITNVGSAPMQIGTISISGPSAAAFAEQNNCVGVAIAPGASCTAQVTFEPDLHADGVVNSGEQMQATLTIDNVIYPISNTSVASTSVALQGTAGLPTVSFYPSFNTLYFAAVQAGQSGTPDPVWLVNDGPGLLQVSSVSTTSPDFTVDDEQCSGQPIAVYGTCKIDVSFTPPITSAAGSVSENLVVATNGAANHSYLALDGYAAPATGVSAIPDTLDFVYPCGFTIYPACQSQTVTVSSTETQPVSITNVAPAIATPGPFSADPSGCTAQPVPPGGTCPITVSLNPNGIPDPVPGTGQVTINDTAGSAGPLTQTVAVRWSPLVVTSQSVDLGSVPVGGVVTQTVTITNEGPGSDTVQYLSTLGGSGGDGNFTAGFGACSFTMAPGQSCSLTIGFQPTTTGQHHATVQFADSDASVPIELLLNGTATAPTPTLFINPTSLSWTTGPSVQTITVANISAAPRTITAVTLGEGSASSFIIASNTCTGATLAPNTACTIAVGVAPSTPLNAFVADTLVITDNLGDPLPGVSLQYNVGG